MNVDGNVSIRNETPAEKGMEWGDADGQGSLDHAHTLNDKSPLLATLIAPPERAYVLDQRVSGTANDLRRLTLVSSPLTFAHIRIDLRGRLRLLRDFGNGSEGRLVAHRQIGQHLA